MLASEASSGTTQMAFLTLRDGVAADDEERAKLAGRWAALLGTNAVKISYHMIGGNELLITEEQGRIIEVKDFVLQQPEVLKFRWCVAIHYCARAAQTLRCASTHITLHARLPAPLAAQEGHRLYAHTHAHALAQAEEGQKGEEGRAVRGSPYRRRRRKRVPWRARCFLNCLWVGCGLMRQ